MGRICSSQNSIQERCSTPAVDLNLPEIAVVAETMVVAVRRQDVHIAILRAVAEVRGHLIAEPLSILKVLGICRVLKETIPESLPLVDLVLKEQCRILEVWCGILP